MFSKVLAILLLLLLPSVIPAQSPDSLVMVWQQRSAQKVRKDTADADLLNTIGRQYEYQGSDSSLYWSRQAIALSKKIGYIRGEATANANIAKLYYHLGEYNRTLQYALVALELSRQIHDMEGTANAYNMMGLVYLTQQEITAALNQFKQAAAINQTLANQNRLSANYFNIALCYLDLKEPDNAYQYLLKSKAIATTIDDRRMRTMANNRIADYYYQKGLISNAIVLYTSVIESKDFQDEWENGFAFTGLAECCYAQHAYNKAIAYGEKGLKLARQANAKWDIERSLNILQKAYKAIGNTAKAYDYLAQEKLYSDSLFNESKETEINGLHLKQQQAENEALAKRAQAEKEKTAVDKMIIVVVVLVALFLCLTLIMLLFNAAKNKRLYKKLQTKSEQVLNQKKLIEQKNQELEKLNQTKDQLFSIVGHDLRTPFANMLGTKELFNNNLLEEGEKQLLFDRFFEQMSVTSAMLENLLLWANNQKKGIITNKQDACPDKIIEELLGLFSTVAEKKQISIVHYKGIHNKISADVDQLRILFQNIITNAIKFTRPGGTVTISTSSNNKAVTIVVKDNGIGMPADKLLRLFHDTGKNISTYGTQQEKGIGIGLLLVDKFVRLNDGHITVSSAEGEGTEFKVSFPANVTG